MSNLSDVVGGANLFGGSNYSFVPDRFCSQNSAIYLNKGYLQVPEGVYFSGDFTFTGWIYLKSNQNSSRLFDFGNGLPKDNIILAMLSTSYQIRGNLFNSSVNSFITTSSKVNLNQWYFIAFVLSNKTGNIYINCNQVANGTLNVPNNLQRTNNYIGKNNWNTYPNADAIFDEFKIYQGALSSNEIINEYLLNSNDGIINYCPSNYWPMSNLSDVVGGANLFGGSNFMFTSDRFGAQNAAIYFNQGYLQVPTGVYFSGDFTVTTWINLKSYQSYSRFFDFGNGAGSDNVLLSMTESFSKMHGVIFKSSLSSYIQTSSIINLNEWYFISFVLSGTTGYIYVNGNQVKTNQLNVPNSILRANNYIGKSNFGNANTDAVYDEFKIYQGALSSSDIMNEYQISLNNGKLLYHK
jgi:hypothetical protein